MKVYAAYYNNNVREDSSSGGMFSLIASEFDVIYGVEMDENNQYAIFARKTKDISSLRGSKYLQARVGDTFMSVKKDLESGLNVLFSGTACQVNGLLNYLQVDFPNLVTIDVICHGVPSPVFYHKFVEGTNVQNINFRAKDGGWNNYTYGMKLNKKYISYNKNKYMMLYIKDLALRPSCYKCLSKTTKRSDFTLGDFWGIEKIYPDMTDNKGTSLVIVRTGKAHSLFEKLKNQLVWKEVTYEEGIMQNTSEYKSSKCPDCRNEFFMDLSKMSFEELYRKYCHKPSAFKRMHNIIRKLINVIGG
jgi:coenzyme F420-reducing hydrogenase beta subunit